MSRCGRIWTEIHECQILTQIMEKEWKTTKNGPVFAGKIKENKIETIRKPVTDMITTEEWPQLAIREGMNKEIETSEREREIRNERMSVAQIINGQVMNLEVEYFGKEFKLMIPGLPS